MTSMTKKELGQKIRLVRLSKSLNQENAATDLGMSLTAYANIENGKTNVPFERLTQIAEYFEITLVDLFGRDNGVYIREKNEISRVEEPQVNYIEDFNYWKNKYIKLLEEHNKLLAAKVERK